ncbi:PREDICTED: uncharacterized protein LOC105961784 [Erythranthe guttata]|uniref:uncharacterized protein LOC105961784 n=1 Tax=Erythranthe guttata TaxID=4155 RepID=UPI00064DF706|nr:PREDICTED: uncharacterized protein LOC105961784 [Erythranthe guttata]|eukprot:XP_012841500.1 PREDICTED: uncharacterized protein LOC105961784 [Erythranthe guttata]
MARGGFKRIHRGSSSQTPSSQQGEVGDSQTTISQERIATRRILLKVDRDSFDPSSATRKLVAIFKRAFSGSWPTWKKVPDYVRDRWFNEFEKLYYWPAEDHTTIRRHFEHKGSVSLSNSLNKARKQFHEKNIIPKWINQNHWNELLAYWNTQKFKDKSEINSDNRNSSHDGLGPSLHTGGSIPVSEYKRKFVSVNFDIL